MEICKKIQITDKSLTDLAYGIELLAKNMVVLTTLEKEGIYKADEAATKEQNAFAWLDKNYGTISGAAVMISAASTIISTAMYEGLSGLIGMGLEKSGLNGWQIED